MTYKTFNVRMMAFGKPGEVRPVDVPEPYLTELTDRTLDLVYRYGQNEFQSKPFPSVSVGDVIEIPVTPDRVELHVVRPVGFAPMTDAEFTEYERIPARDRSWSKYVRPEEE